jgi:hypothetical protein
VKHLHVVSLTFRNDGDRPFHWGQDVREPVSLTVRGSGEILAVVAVNRSGDRPPVRIERVQRRGNFTVGTEFLNAGESFSLVVYHDSDSSSQLDVHGRFYDHSPLSVARSAGTAGRGVVTPLRDSVLHGLAVGILLAALLRLLARMAKVILSRRAGSASPSPAFSLIGAPVSETPLAGVSRLDESAERASVLEDRRPASAQPLCSCERGTVELVMSVLSAGKPTSAGDIAEATGLGKADVERALDYMMQCATVETAGDGTYVVARR